MTAEEWRSDDDAREHLKFVQDQSDRKLRLLCCACCRILMPKLKHRACEKAIEGAELFADGLISAKELRTRRDSAKSHVVDESRTPAEYASAAVSRKDYVPSWVLCLTCATIAVPDVKKGNAIQCALFRDIFGNPFRPVTLDPRWLSSTVLDLARTIYDERVYERLPVLADALMDAGCDSEEVINHCRETGPHVRGCWVVDLLLGKT